MGGIEQFIFNNFNRSNICTFIVIIPNFNLYRETVEPVLDTGGCEEVELVQLKKDKIVVEKK